jgi:DNA-binding NarL/FixJ family response regulator
VTVAADNLRAAIDERLDEIFALLGHLAAVESSPPARLTPMVLRTAYMAAARLSVTEIARERHVSRDTVKTQLKSAYKALKVANRSQLRAALIRRQTNA